MTTDEKTTNETEETNEETDKPKETDFEKEKREAEEKRKGALDKLDKLADGRGYEAEVDPALEKALEEKKTPKVRVVKKVTIGETIRAVKLAKKEFGGGDSDYQPTQQEVMVCKMAYCCTFDGEHWNAPDIQEALDEDFFQYIGLRFIRFLGQ